ncbi:ATP-dependent DNA helicase RecG [bacterium]|nr:MAG: ATP-dependent DNA helicase RecG [bacterium]
MDEDEEAEEFARIVPVYALKEGVNQKLVRRAVRSAVEHYLDLVQEPLPTWLLIEQKLKALPWCLREIHLPQDEERRRRARKRLVFEEFFYMQAGLALRRQELSATEGIAFPIESLLRGEGDASGRLIESASGEPLWDQIHRMLPFELTGAQRRVIDEVFGDMGRPHPMNRLLQGDVGSGKTAVAVCAILAAVRSGYQAAMMAPTEILAEQHAASLRTLLEPLGIGVELMVGKLTPKQRAEAHRRAAAGEAEVFVGTHALITESVSFANLGLAVIDEQHRFGVLQRKALRDKAKLIPDVLVMTATPIPRTLTMWKYGDLDYSVIDELPPGRKPIKTRWFPPYERDAIYDSVRKRVDEGRQAYFVCPMVSESEKMNAQAAEDLYEELQNGAFHDLRVALLHGQMKPKEKEAVMDAFRRHESDVLVSTTVIEVGVDVPNASIMVIEDANRFGLAQLHQLRGRVGRGQYQSYCVLVADAKNEESRKRLETMVETNDGFRIAEVDLELRGPGMVAGTQQSGNADLGMADLVHDGRLLEVARQAAIDAVERDPGLASDDWNLVRDRIRGQRDAFGVAGVS